MSIQKKSLISERAVVKKAMIANQPVESNAAIGELKSLQTMSLKAKRGHTVIAYRAMKKK